MARIQLMDHILADKIAAGEVVERCASVVKELVENSIDAKSTEIHVDLIEAGTKEIKVTDNGSGMDKEDAKMAFHRHATSKLYQEDDLYHINTLGFRGEALASIASVSEITLKTSMGDVGTTVEIAGGEFLNISSSDARKGTEISVRNLFYNTPARLKHMKSLYTELASITDYINKLALSYPDIKFVLTNNNSTLLNTDGSGNLLKTIHAIYGLDTVKKMVFVQGENDDYSVEGYVTLPEVHRSTRSHMTTIVNGRIVRNQELNRTINDAYHSYKPDNRYPITVLKITVDPSLVDVNIHPTKQDIKFSKMEELEQLISTMIRKSFEVKTLIPEIPLEKKTEPKKVYQEIKFEFSKVAEEETPYEEVLINEDLIQEKESSNEQEVNQQEKEDRLPDLYPVGLVHGTYIICQNDLGMYLIDQHAAKERINYEIYHEKLSHPTLDSIALLFPITIELTNSEFITLKQNFDLLKNLSFEIEEFGIHSVVVKRHPVWLPKGYEEEAIRKIIDVILQEEKNFSLEKLNDHLSATLACKMSIKANTSITIGEMEHLISDLRGCKNPFNCPHGRPTIIFYSKEELEKQFKRSGF